MSFLGNAIINGYSAILIVALYLQSIKHIDSRSVQHRLYKALLITTFFMLLADTLGRLDGNPNTYYAVLNQIGNFVLYLFNQLIPSFWLLYVASQVCHSKKRKILLKYIIISVLIINFVLLIITQFNGFYYYIDSQNIYHRGKYAYIAYLLTGFLIIMANVIAVLNRNALEKKHFVSLVSFAILPTVCLIVQSLVYGISLMFSGVTIMLLVIYFNIQNKTIFTDYLTGISNRMKLEFYLKEKIESTTNYKTFGAIMLDINNFKTTNDKFGHSTGDEILRRAAKLLRSCIRPDDFLARFGGDEFFVVLDVATEDELQDIIEKIKLCLSRYNRTSEPIYKIEFSMGYKLYDTQIRPSPSEFEKQLDVLMYTDKQLSKTRHSPLPKLTPKPPLNP